ncbi:MAG TPA: hypothetical protein VE196_10920 [Pseudonocardiaceae bacterium]|nr:hypothetical protein [Pseudonocardiaceae bacterium]
MSAWTGLTAPATSPLKRPTLKSSGPRVELVYRRRQRELALTGAGAINPLWPVRI